jgi:hypothetical protein
MDGLTLLGQYLEEHGHTKREFARLAKLPAPMVSVWCRSETVVKRKPGRKNARKIEIATQGKVPSAYWDTLPTANGKF